MPRIGARLVCVILLLASLGLLAQVAVAQYGPLGRVHLPLVLGPQGNVPPTVVPSAPQRPTATMTQTMSAPATTTPTVTATHTASPTATQSPTAVTPGLQQLLANRDFEQGNTVWVQSSNSTSHIIIQDGVGRWSSWGAEFGGRYDAQDFLEQTVTIPVGITHAHVSFSVKMETFEPSTDVRSMLAAFLYDEHGALLETLVTYDNTDAALVWQSVFSGELVHHAGERVTIVFGCITDGPTTFYVDDAFFLVEF